jgi:hypothetical protein
MAGLLFQRNYLIKSNIINKETMKIESSHYKVDNEPIFSVWDYAKNDKLIKVSEDFIGLKKDLVYE